MKKILMICTIIGCIFTILIFTPIKSRQILLDKTDPSQEIQINKEGEPIALSVYGRGFTEGDQIYLNGEAVETDFGNKGWMTCYISDEIYIEQESIEIQIKRLDDKGKVVTKSNKKTLDIKR